MKIDTYREFLSQQSENVFQELNKQNALVSLKKRLAGLNERANHIINKYPTHKLVTHHIWLTIKGNLRCPTYGVYN